MSGTWVQVSAAEVETRYAAVHNLTVADLHTYHVAAGRTAPLTHNAGGSCKEAVLDKFDTYEQARNKALDLLGEINPATRESYCGRLEAAESTYGSVVGFTVRVNGIFKRFRNDYGPDRGPHFNVEVGKGDSARKWAVPWSGSERDFMAILRGNT